MRESRSTPRPWHWTAVFRVLVSCILAASIATTVHGAAEKLLELDLEELLDMRVTTASKKEQDLFHTPAAVYVITQEDIRRLGVTSIPEALRIVPGVEVARIDVDKWAITSRGFNSRYASKLLVMVDGRSLYSPSFSGVFWESLDLFLADVDRIEVIRGPGGAVWGANAVNGVINIITRRASETTGVAATGSVGSRNRGSAEARFGSGIGEHTHYRVYGKAFRTEGPPSVASGDAHEWSTAQLGFRMDSSLGQRDELILQGSMLRGEVEETLQGPVSIWSPGVATGRVTIDWSEMSLLGRYHRNISDRSSLGLQAYLHRWDRNWVIDDERSLFDVEVQHRFPWWSRHDVVWGGGYRVSRDHIEASPISVFRFTKERETIRIANVFLQDEISLVDSALRLTLGAKAEHNKYTGVEWQPTARLLYAPLENVAAWGAVSRAVRTPDRSDRDLRVDFAVIPGGEDEPPTLLSILGNPDLNSESVVAYEAGFRWQSRPLGTIDVATFLNDYSMLRGLTPVAPFMEADPAPPHLVVANRFANVGDGIGYGVEATIRRDITPAWRMTANYSWLQLELDASADATEPGLEDVERRSPNHRVSLRSQVNLTSRLQWDAMVHYVSKLREFDVAAYTRLDVRLGWMFGEREELSVGGINLLDAKHYEFGDMDGVTAVPVERQVYVRFSFRH